MKIYSPHNYKKSKWSKISTDFKVNFIVALLLAIWCYAISNLTTGAITFVVAMILFAVANKAHNKKYEIK